MILHEFTVLGPPLSHQTRDRGRLQGWRETVAAAARLEQLAHAQDAAALPNALKLLEDEMALLLPELEVHLAKFEL